MPIPQDDIDKAEEAAEENGRTLYEELEEQGYTAGEIRDQFLDPYDYDQDLENFLNERDSSCSNDELGLDEDGNREDS
jgi:hypothetical protein